MVYRCQTGSNVPDPRFDPPQPYVFFSEPGRLLMSPNDGFLVNFGDALVAAEVVAVSMGLSSAGVSMLLSCSLKLVELALWRDDF